MDSGRAVAGELELAFELLRRQWGRGYATEAALTVMGRARSSGHERLWATVWDWNTPSRRVLDKLGFVETCRREVDPARGTTLFTVCTLCAGRTGIILHLSADRVQGEIAAGNVDVIEVQRPFLRVVRR